LIKAELQLQGQFGTDEEHLHLQADGQRNGGFHTQLAEYSAAVVVAAAAASCLVQQQIHHLSLLEACPPVRLLQPCLFATTLAA
jgi:hypothetical protein